MAWDSDIGDGSNGALRDSPPDLFSPIDDRAGVSGHAHPPPRGTSIHEAPEHDWSVARNLVMPLLRATGTHGTRLSELHPDRLATAGLRTHPLPVIDIGPEDLTVGFALRGDGFDVLVNADHLLEWHIGPDELRSVAMANLERWSTGAGWEDEAEGGRRLRSSETGEGHDASRILLPEVRRQLSEALGTEGRVIVGVPERHLLVAGALRPDDEEFGGLFAEFVASRAEGSDEPVDRRVFELVGGELRLAAL
jgi:hypothetical protein